jgi:hypothetical protein
VAHDRYLALSAALAHVKNFYGTATKDLHELREKEILEAMTLHESDRKKLYRTTRVLEKKHANVMQAVIEYSREMVAEIKEKYQANDIEIGYASYVMTYTKRKRMKKDGEQAKLSINFPWTVTQDELLALFTYIQDKKEETSLEQPELAYKNKVVSILVPQIEGFEMTAAEACKLIAENNNTFVLQYMDKKAQPRFYAFVGEQLIGYIHESNEQLPMLAGHKKYGIVVTNTTVNKTGRTIHINAPAIYRV